MLRDPLPPIARWTSRRFLDTTAGGPRKFEKPAAELYDRLSSDNSWNPLIQHASEFRNLMPCRVLPDELARGDFHLLLRLMFEDGIIWVARIHLPTTHSDTRGQDKQSIESTMKARAP